MGKVEIVWCYTPSESPPPSPLLSIGIPPYTSILPLCFALPSHNVRKKWPQRNLKLETPSLSPPHFVSGTPSLIEPSWGGGGH